MTSSAMWKEINGITAKLLANWAVWMEQQNCPAQLCNRYIFDFQGPSGGTIHSL